MGDSINPNNVRKWMPIMYATFYGILKEIAEKHGYAVAVHGSLTRDMDLVLIPWIEHPGPVIKVLKEWHDTIDDCPCSEDGVPYSSIGNKPHGRIAYTIPTGGGGYIDVSVMPTKESEANE
jgi:hypothetical protein